MKYYLISVCVFILLLVVDFPSTLSYNSPLEVIVFLVLVFGQREGRSMVKWEGWREGWMQGKREGGKVMISEEDKEDGRERGKEVEKNQRNKESNCEH